MAVYVISYDLRKPKQNYQGLYDAIKSYGTWWHALDSTWMIVSNDTAINIANSLVSYMDSNDSLVVVEHTGDAAWFGFSGDAESWLKNNL